VAEVKTRKTPAESLIDNRRGRDREFGGLPENESSPVQTEVVPVVEKTEEPPKTMQWSVMTPSRG